MLFSGRIVVAVVDKSGGRLGFEGQIKVIFSKDTRDKFHNSKSYRNHKWYIPVRPTIEKNGFFFTCWRPFCVLPI